jgi:hypothetical protein
MVESRVSEAIMKTADYDTRYMIFAFPATMSKSVVMIDEQLQRCEGDRQQMSMTRQMAGSRMSPWTPTHSRIFKRYK